MAIEMSGGIYCPLSPRDPRNRLDSLVQETKCDCVIVHHLTQNKFRNNIATVDIAIVVREIFYPGSIDLHRLEELNISPDNVAYIILTSGSTGKPKAVSFFSQPRTYL